MTAEQLGSPELPELKDLIGQDIRVVQARYGKNFDEILERAREADGAERVTTALKGVPPADNGRQLCIYVEPETRVITSVEIIKGPDYKPIAGSNSSSWERIGSDENSTQFKQK